MKMFLVLTLIALSIDLSFSCSCIPADPVRDHCRSNFVGVVSVTGGPYPCSPEMVCYDVTLTNSIKGTVKQIKTAPSSASCGINLTSGGRYLLMGQQVSSKYGQVVVTQCPYSQNVTNKKEKCIARLANYFNNICC
ncbi:hypothetical protein HDE_08606 [Halotydeus destructor]|nr:hypothetical protein HDE_08606 [Halotydeus destructor]